MSGKPLKVCLVAPLPPPYGGIGHWASMLCGYAVDKNVIIRVVDVSPRWRSIDDLRVWKRVLFGGMTMVWHVLLVIWNLLRGYRVVHIATPGQLSVYRDLAIVLIAKLFRAGTLYHLHFGRVPAIAGTNTNEWKRIRLVMRLADIVVPLDIATEKTIQFHLPMVRIVRVPNCLDISKSPPIPPAEANIRTMLYLGWVVPTKGINELVIAWSELSPTGWRLQIVGPVDDGYREKLLEQYHPANLDFVGEKSHDEAMTLLAAADVLVLPSHTEGFPNVIMEAMSLGKAIIATSVGALPEILDGGCGLLFPPQQVNRLKDAMTEIMTTPQLRYTMGQTAKAKAINDYALPKVFGQLQVLWAELAGITKASLGAASLKVCLVAPLPPPYGGIGHWTSLICNYAVGTDISLHVVNVAPRWRQIDDLRIWKRVVFGGLTMLWHVTQVIWHLLRGCRVVHIATPGQLSVFRDTAVVFVAKLFRVPAIYHIRFGGVPQIAEQNTREWRRMARVMNWSHHVIAIDCKTFVAIGQHLPKASVIQLPNCVDISRLPASTPNAQPPYTVLYIAWIIPTKGIDELIHAWSEMKTDGWKLQVVGPGDVEYQKQLLHRYQPANVEFLGENSHADAMRLLSEAAIFILPSYTEGFPNVIAEAMAMGKAIIATSVGAIPEMLAGGCGKLIPPKDVNAIKLSLVELMTDAALRDRMGDTARVRARDDYSLSIIFERLEAIWRSAAQSRGFRICQQTTLPKEGEARTNV